MDAGEVESVGRIRRDRDRSDNGVSMATRLKKATPPASVEAIPATLRQIPRWIVWDYVDYNDGKKPRKVPITPGRDHGLNYNTASAWRPFDAVLEEAGRRGGLGIGFVFSDDDDLVGVDLDNAMDDAGNLKPWAQEIVGTFPTWAESSPSGTGVHIIGRAERIAGTTRVTLSESEAVERYSQGRWFTFSGGSLNDEPVADIREAMAWLDGRHFRPAATAPRTAAIVDRCGVDVDLDIELARVCLDNIAHSRACNGDDWRKVGMALKATSEQLAGDWLSFSQRWPEYDEAECRDRWARFAPSEVSLGTLVFMATTDSGKDGSALRREAATRLGRTATTLPERVPRPATADELAAVGVMTTADTTDAKTAAPYDNGVITFDQCVEEYLAALDDAVLPTGFRPFDDATDGGLPVGELTGLCAPPGAGKSALALQLVIGAMIHDASLRALWCLGEMTPRILVRRAACVGTAILGDGELTMKDAKRRTTEARAAAESMRELVGGGRLSVLKPALTVSRIAEAITATQARLVVIDYLQLMTGAGHDRIGEMEDRVAQLTALANTTETAIVVVSSMSKAAIGNGAKIGTIGKGSGQIDYAMSFVFLGEPDEEAIKAKDTIYDVKWHCTKSRNEARHDFLSRFDGSRQFYTQAVEEYEAFATFGINGGRS